jgi:hypothetical protein
MIKDYNYYKERYEKKAEQLTITPGSLRYFEPNFGFIYYRPLEDPDTHERIIYLDHTCIEDWTKGEQVMIEIAKQHQCTAFRTYVYRSPRAYRKLSRGILDTRHSTFLPNGKFYWCFYRRLIP